MTLNVKDAAGTTVPLKSTTDTGEEVPHHIVDTGSGAGVTIGETTDLAVSTDAVGTLSGKIRGIVKILADVLGLASNSAATAGGTGTLSAKTRKISETLGDVADAGVTSMFASGSIKAIASGMLGWLDAITTSTQQTRDNVGDVGVAAVTTNTTGSVSGKLRGIVAILADVWDSTATALKVRSVAVVFNREATLTRPANTTVYTAGDAVTDTGGAIRTFTNIASANGKGARIDNAVMIYQTLIAAPGYFELWLLDTTCTPTTDNAAFAPDDGESATVVAIIPFNLISNAAANMVYQSDGVPRTVKCAAGTTSLFGLVKTPNGYTPAANSETMIFRLQGVQLD